MAFLYPNLHVHEQTGHMDPHILRIWQRDIVACQGGGVSSKTANQGVDKTTLPFSPLKGGLLSPNCLPLILNHATWWKAGSSQYNRVKKASTHKSRLISVWSAASPSYVQANEAQELSFVNRIEKKTSLFQLIYLTFILDSLGGGALLELSHFKAYRYRDLVKIGMQDILGHNKVQVQLWRLIDLALQILPVD